MAIFGARSGKPRSLVEHFLALGDLLRSWTETGRWRRADRDRRATWIGGRRVLGYGGSGCEQAEHKNQRGVLHYAHSLSDKNVRSRPANDSRCWEEWITAAELLLPDCHR